MAERLVTLRRHGRQALARAHSGWLTRATQAGNGSSVSPVMLVGMPRSGTTWLMEVLCRGDGVTWLYEPLRPGSDSALPPVGRPGGFVSSGDFAEHPELVRYLDDVLSGRRVSRWSARGVSATELNRSTQRVVKMIRLCMAADWVVTTYPRTPTIGLVRHPCAFVESILRSPGEWSQWVWTDFEALTGSGAGSSLRSLRGLDRVELLAHWWGAQAAALNRALTDGRGLLVRHEDLVGSASYIDEVFRFAGITLPPSDELRLSLPSSTSNADGSMQSISDPTSFWKSRLDERDASRVSEIVRSYPDAADLYSE